MFDQTVSIKELPQCLVLFTFNIQVFEFNRDGDTIITALTLGCDLLNDRGIARRSTFTLQRAHLGRAVSKDWALSLAWKTESGLGIGLNGAISTKHGSEEFSTDTSYL